MNGAPGRLAWGAIGIAGGALVAASFLPAFAIRIVATIGAGDAQRAFDYERSLAFVPGLQPVGLVPLAAGLAVVLAATMTAVAGPRWWLTVLAFVASLGPSWILLDTPDRIEPSSITGVTGYDEPHGGRSCSRRSTT